ncbi:hypothetical protein CANARDRAFT_7637 [[Candida] arabinofermentans NRRL YB-2248]|uniref:Man1/Src1 C-terminal domain-containing protein n=1 Tax=[Candida] arabinofermentans NRRL YB-2248 TaxID=983967 RepID=A0A1E4T1C6_9ASCO|nr:hypothetical protein CANARDRAFT_7637 [[Candida] arabinofermentans NRRL YB-2248]
MDEKEYLQPDFNPNKLTIPKLRSIMLDHDIEYPSSAKKGDFIELFETHIRPNSAKLLEEYNKINVASGEGVVFLDVPKKKAKSSRSTTPVHHSEIEKHTEGSPFTKNNVFQSSSKEGTPKSKAVAKPSSPPSPPLSPPVKAGSSIPAKRELEHVSPKKKKLSRRKKESTDDSQDSFDLLSPAESSKVRKTSPSKALLTQEKFEDNSDDIFDSSTFFDKKYERSKSKNASDILEGFKKSVPNGKITKKAASAKKPKPTPSKIENGNGIGNDTFIAKSFDSGETKADEPYLNSTDLGDGGNGEVDVDLLSETFEFIQPDLPTRSSPVKIVSHVNSEDSHIENLAGPTRRLSMSSYDDEKTLKSVKLDDDNKEIVIEEKSVVQEVDVELDTKTDVEDTEEDGIEVLPLKNTFDAPSFKKKNWIWALIKLTCAVSALSSGAGALYAYRELSLNTGYCGLPSSVIKPFDLATKVPASISKLYPDILEYADAAESALVSKLNPSCVFCPEHGTCYEKSKLVCEPDYKIHTPWYSVFGLIPNLESCEYDHMKKETFRIMREYTMRTLHKRGDKELTLEELHNFLKATKSSHISDKEFEQYWANFVNDELPGEPAVKIDFTSRSISIANMIPSEFLTRSLGPKNGKKKGKFFAPYAIPSTTKDTEESAFTKFTVGGLL